MAHITWQDILELGAAYNNMSVKKFSKISPKVYDDYPGVRFHHVGHNASHDFELGINDEGEVFLRASGESLTQDEDGLPNLDIHVRKLSPSAPFPYIGHF